MVSRIYLVNSDALDVILFLYFITDIFFFAIAPPLECGCGACVLQL